MAVVQADEDEIKSVKSQCIDLAVKEGAYVAYAYAMRHARVVCACAVLLACVCVRVCVPCDLGESVQQP